MESIKPVAVSPKSSQDVINVVIIGCGYAGALVAKRIDDYLADKYFKVESSSPKSNTINPMKKEIKLTVIDRHDSVWLKISAIRSTVSEGWVQRTQIPISEVVKRGTFVQGNVTSVDKVSKKVYVSLTGPTAADPKKDASYPYDVLLCASGALNGSPADLPTTINTKSQINSYLAGARKSIEESTKIGIIGGGMTSVEFAGEIRAMYPDKKITIICAASKLFTSSIAKPTKTFMKALQERLKALRVDVIFNERAVSPNAKDFIETPYLSGTRVIECEGQTNVKLEVDLTIWAGSWRFNNSFYPSEWMNDMGELQIRDTFQLESESDVFAFGDISSFLETKQAITLVPKVDIIVNNIMTIAEMKSSFGENKKKSKLKVCKMNDRALIYLPLGANDGVSISRFGFTYGGKKTSEWKGKDLFVNKFWNLMTGHEAPSINASDS